jgi:aminoglycoside phosphotransferase (APT) family kinase protein
MMTGNTPLPHTLIQWITNALGNQAKIHSIRQLKGSTSATLYQIQIGETLREYNLILRLLTNAEWLQEEPDLAEHEAAALTLAKQSGLLVPEVVAYDPAGNRCGIPALLMTEIPGCVNLTPDNFDDWLRQMAEALLPLHLINARDFHWQYHPYYNPDLLQIPAWSRKPELWKRAFETIRQPAPETKYCFIHRDYHPMNTLWLGDQLSGIVDWINACQGPAPFDLAWNRLNLMQMYGLEAAERLRFYAIQACDENVWHPYWDLMALCELLPGPPEIYQPWLDFGLNDLSTPLLISRTEDYLASILGSL